MTRPETESPPRNPAFQIRWPEEIRDQVMEYATRIGIPINSVIMVFLNDGLKEAGFPGVVGSGANGAQGN